MIVSFPAFLDSCVLVPINVTDVVPRFAEEAQRLPSVRWS
ncbi:hypothetical protein BJ969_004399 [Saccharopolyspora gloriosae]|uniref:PIN domain-containing protein n=1 Tax=Saccharopolyspora gloriosae TaxID=455344 RepID=A0A840NJS3_9PSEU|nr:hypothetical protein [Saccharopolyspora gloriosae]